MIHPSSSPPVHPPNSLRELWLEWWSRHKFSRQRILGTALVAALAISFATSSWFPRSAQAVLPNGYPERMAIYYGDPAAVNGSAGNTTLASDVFNDYDMVIFGEGIEQDTHAYHTTTQTIIQNIQSTTRTYGYLDLCVENPVSSLYRCSNFSMAELQSRTNKWKAMGAVGIFLDQAGCDYVVSRQRQNDIIDYIHSQGLSAFINVWNQDDAFYPGSLPSPYAGYANCNPNNLSTHLGSNDYTLLESWAIILSDWSENWTVDPNMLMPRGDKALQYKNQYGTKVATVNTIAQGNPPFEQNKFEYVWWTTLLYGFDAMAWGETWVYSSDTNSLPFHTRPNPGNIGNAITPLSVTHNSNLHTRSTTAGYVQVNTTSHVGQFVYQGTPPPTYTPTRTPTPTATPLQHIVTQSGSASTDLIQGNAVFTAGTVIFTLRTNGAPFEYFHIFIDSDGNTATGHFRASTQGTTYTNVGADYMVENGYIYSFCGTAQSQVCWTPVTPNNNATVTGQGTNQLQVTVTYQQINYSSPTVTKLLAEHMSTGYVTYDMLLRSVGTTWQAPTTGGPTPTNTPIGPTFTPTRTPTRTNTPTGPTFTPTRTPTPTNTPVVPTATPTSSGVSNTGWISPAAQVSQSGGDGNGFQTNPSNAFSDNGTFAVDTDSGNGTSTTCSNSSKDRHAFSSYNISLPAGSTIHGIEVRLDARADSTTGAPRMCVEISWNNGTSWTAIKTGPNLATTERTDILGSATDTWGRTWTTSELTSANFRVRIMNVASNTSRDFSLDWVPIRIYYTAGAGPTATPTPTHTPVGPTATPTPTQDPNGWVNCASEGGTCTFSGTQQIRFGDSVSGFYSTRNATGSIACNTATFGDPKPGATKSCQRRINTGAVGPFSLIGYTQCAAEGGTCTFSGNKQVVFGNSGWFMARTATGSIACNTATFGDPLLSIAKVCWVQP